MQNGAREPCLRLLPRRVRIKNFSDFGADFEYYLQPVGAEGQNEDEILFSPGTRFVIDDIETYTNSITQVTMHEVAQQHEMVAAGVARGRQRKGVAAVASGGLREKRPFTLGLAMILLLSVVMAERMAPTFSYNTSQEYLFILVKAQCQHHQPSRRFSMIAWCERQLDITQVRERGGGLGNSTILDDSYAND